LKRQDEDKGGAIIALIALVEDIFEYFTEKMRPPQKEEPRMDLTLDFEQVPVFIDRGKEAA